MPLDNEDRNWLEGKFGEVHRRITAEVKPLENAKMEMAVTMENHERRICDTEKDLDSHTAWHAKDREERITRQAASTARMWALFLAMVAQLSATIFLLIQAYIKKGGQP